MLVKLNLKNKKINKIMKLTKTTKIDWIKEEINEPMNKRV